MKLKRLLCALVVFTLMMTSVVCSVSAATYQTTTVHNLSSAVGDEGSVSLKTTITGLDDGSMVSYIIYDNDDGKNTITEDTIAYIDQQTATEDNDYTLVFGEEAEFTDYLLAKHRYTFVSSGTESFTYDELHNLNNNAVNASAGTLPKDTTDIKAENWCIRFYTRLGKTPGATNTTYYDGIKSLTFDSYTDHFGKQITTPLTMMENDALKTAELLVHPGSTTVISVVPKEGYKVSEFNVKRQEASKNGGDSYVGDTVYYHNYLIGGKVKLDPKTTDMGKNGYLAPGGDYRIQSVKATQVGDGSTVKYVKIDGEPIYAENSGEKSVTFLMTKSAAITGEYGINLYAFNKETTPGVESLSDAEVVFTGLKAIEATDANKFGIQVFAPASDDNAKYLDSANYELVAIPYCGTEELAATGDDLFYTVDNADLSGGSFKEVE